MMYITQKVKKINAIKTKTLVHPSFDSVSTLYFGTVTRTKTSSKNSKVTFKPMQAHKKKLCCFIIKNHFENLYAKSGRYLLIKVSWL